MMYMKGDLRDQLAHLGRSVVRAGLVVGSGGNMSARIPGTDECWVTATGSWLEQLDRTSFVRIRWDEPFPTDDRTSGETNDNAFLVSPLGAAASTDIPAMPTSELALHLAVYRARRDATVVVHLHPQTVLLLEALGEPIRLATTDHRYYLHEIGVVPFHPPGTAVLAAATAAAIGGGLNCVVLARHGCCVVADSVELAHKRVLNLGEAAELTYRALLLGRVAELAALPPGGTPAPGRI
ncbi:MAG: class II aldolase/adducin family protein [Dactylosporangium sp.]|nr:class II aldolase/adducin family protein [Dactylosporangium sp.]NNJ59672.1 class II aldolase/adducin family protein [Dactylosporangium sp.]